MQNDDKTEQLCGVDKKKLIEKNCVNFYHVRGGFLVFGITIEQL